MVSLGADRAKLLEDGYLIVRDCVPPELLPDLRAAADAVTRASEISLSGPTQPRVSVDFKAAGGTAEQTAATQAFVGFCLDDATLGRSRRLMGCEKVAVHQMQCFLNPGEEPPEDIPPPGQDWGTDPRNWHRDTRPDHDPPLELVLRDQENSVAYLQWNIALLPESCLRVLPGSHRRLTTESELQELNRNPQSEELAGSVVAELGAGDGVVYINTILHRGSGYTPRQPRLTLHLAYRAFDSPLWPRQTVFVWDSNGPGLARLAEEQRRALTAMANLQAAQQETVASLLRAVLGRDARGAEAALATLHPAEAGRETALVLCAVTVRDLLAYHAGQGGASHGGDGGYVASLHAQFAAEMEELRARFMPLERLLAAEEPRHVRGFLGPPVSYVYDKLPAGSPLLSPGNVGPLLQMMLAQPAL